MSKRKHNPKTSRKRAQQPPWLIAGIGLVVAVGALIVGLATRTSASSVSAPANFTPQVTGAPRVAVAQAQIDHGDVKLGLTINSVFQVRNVGDKPLQILGEPRVEVVEGC